MLNFLNYNSRLMEGMSTEFGASEGWSASADLGDASSTDVVRGFSKGVVTPNEIAANYLEKNVLPKYDVNKEDQALDAFRGYIRPEPSRPKASSLKTRAFGILLGVSFFLTLDYVSSKFADTTPFSTKVVNYVSNKLSTFDTYYFGKD